LQSLFYPQMSQINADFFRLAARKARGQPTSPHLPTVLWACSPQRHIIPQTKPKHTHTPPVLRACSPQRHIIPQTKPKHTHTPTVLWACSPQRHIIPQTKTQAHAYADRAAGYQPAASHHPANASLCAANA
jgi:hypothetical protein